MPSRFHDAAKILLTASPVWTLMTIAVDRAAVAAFVTTICANTWPTCWA
jgi:hypothetical protein